ncbi:MAG: von Willebrand factor type A domain-containing protein [Candidatus Eisenbacteria bacterium]
MKERLERNRARLTEADERRIWQAITDERRKTKKARPAWSRFRIPAFAGAAVVAALLVVTYLGQTPGDRSAIEEMAKPRAQRMDDRMERTAPAPETTAVFEEEAKAEADEAESVEGERKVEGREEKPVVHEVTDLVANSHSEVVRVEDPEEPEIEQDHAPSGGRPDLVKEKDAGTQEAPAPASPRLPDGKLSSKVGLTFDEDREKTSPPDAPSKEKSGRSDLVGEARQEAKGAPEPTLGEPRRMAVTSRMLAEPVTDTALRKTLPALSSTVSEEKKTGSLSGTVRDAETRKPIAWADVLIDGTGMGGISRQDGTFTIFNIPPGTYTVIVNMMGYARKIFEGVSIEAGKATSLHVELGERPTKIDTIGIGGKMEYDRKKSNTESNTDRENFKIRALNTVTDGLSRQPGVTMDAQGKVHVRGGRADATPFTVAAPADGSGWPVSVGGTDPVNGEAFDAMFFEHYGVNPFIDPEEDSLATFAVDVDRASYTLTRSYLYRNALPPKEGIRVEEFVNAFTHGYEPPKKDAFGIHLDAAPSPFGEGYVLLRVGLKGREVEVKDRKPAVLTFVIDVSGSMGREDRLELVKWSLLYLLDEMTGEDRIGIVVYGSQARVVLEPTAASDRRAIEKAIASLKPEGSTNAEAGLRVGYEMAGRAFRKDAVNRVILCSDGVANVGRTGAESILERIESEASKGIEITAVGFGMGNYNDVLMEQLADKGDGNYYYVDVTNEAKRVFRENLTGTLQTIAKEVKVQVEFEPGTVRRYRLLGYENRDVKDEDFRNDRVDAGEIGAGHEVTALFEVKLERKPKGKRLAVVRVRHEDPESGKVTERSESIGIGDVRKTWGDADPTFRIDAAVAEFAEILRKSYWARESRLDAAYRLARDAAHDLEESSEANELLDLIDRAERLMAKEAEWWKSDDSYRPAWEKNDQDDR